MDMGGPVKLNGVVIYAFIAPNGENGVGVRVSTDDWERLCLCPGHQVRVEGPGANGTFLLASAAEEPPLVWVRFRPLTSRVAG
jgi:hypothetical protein